MGAVDYTNDEVPAAQLADEPNPIEAGYLLKNISFVSGELNEIGGEQEGTIVFKIITGDCLYAWKEQSQSSIYTFSNQAGEEASIILDLASCKVDTEGP